MVKKKDINDINRGTECSFCGHTYIFPCNGKRYDCGNAVWTRTKGRVDFYKLPREQQIKIAKTGKIPDDISTEKIKARMVEKPAEKSKRRVRL